MYKQHNSPTVTLNEICDKFVALQLEIRKKYKLYTNNISVVLRKLADNCNDICKKKHTNYITVSQ